MAFSGDRRQTATPSIADTAGRSAAAPGSEVAQEGVLALQAPLDLHFGGRLPAARLAWRLSGGSGAPAATSAAGTPASAAPVIVALGGISASRHVYSASPLAGGETQASGSAQGPASTPSGWWNAIVGPGRPLDSRTFRVLGIDYLGGSGESTGPQAATDFPSISAYDQAEALNRLADHLRVEKFQAIVGASYGGMVALAFAERFPDRVAQIVAISAADRAHPLSTAWRSVQRAIVRSAIGRGEGAAGLQLARALAMATYRSPEEFAQRFGGEPRRTAAGGFEFPVESYLYARGRDYSHRYLPEAFACLSESIDLHRVTAGNIHTPTALIAVEEDQLVPLADMRSLRDRLGGPAELHEISSLYGHDAFLKEVEVLRSLFERILRPKPAAAAP